MAIIMKTEAQRFARKGWAIRPRAAKCTRGAKLVLGAQFCDYSLCS